MVYLELEADVIYYLKKYEKELLPEEMLEGARRIKEAGVKISVMVILGLGVSIKPTNTQSKQQKWYQQWHLHI